MCVYSMVLDYGRQRIPPYEWDSDKWIGYKDLLRKAEETDKILKQPDCEDPEKLKWMQEIEERLRKLEGNKEPQRLPIKINISGISDGSLREKIEKEVKDVISRSIAAKFGIEFEEATKKSR